MRLAITIDAFLYNTVNEAGRGETHMQRTLYDQGKLSRGVKKIIGFGWQIIGSLTSRMRKSGRREKPSSFLSNIKYSSMA